MVLVIGAGLAGSLASLALRERGLPVILLSESQAVPPATPSATASATPSATALSYGGVPWWAAPAMARAPELWQALERRHGSLGWQSCRLTLHAGLVSPPGALGFPGPEQGLSGATDSAWSLAGPGAPGAAELSPNPQALAAARTGLKALLAASGLDAWERQDAAAPDLGLELPYGRVDGRVLAAALPAALERAGVQFLPGRALALESPPGSPWQVRLASGAGLEAETVLLAAGAGSARLWPPLAAELATSWAGVLALGGDAIAAADLPPGASAGIVMPLLGQRQALEQQTPTRGESRAVVDAGLAPWGSGWLLGQISLINPRGQCDPEPDPAWMEARLRSGLARVWPQLAYLPARYHQMPVSFTASGAPMVGPVVAAPGLWICAGVGAPFAALPPLVETLAEQLAAPA